MKNLDDISRNGYYRICSTPLEAAICLAEDFSIKDDTFFLPDTCIYQRIKAQDPRLTKNALFNKLSEVACLSESELCRIANEALVECMKIESDTHYSIKRHILLCGIRQVIDAFGVELVFKPMDAFVIYTTVYAILTINDKETHLDEIEDSIRTLCISNDDSLHGLYDSIFQPIKVYANNNKGLVSVSIPKQFFLDGAIDEIKDWRIKTYNYNKDWLKKLVDSSFYSDMQKYLVLGKIQAAYNKDLANDWNLKKDEGEITSYIAYYMDLYKGHTPNQEIVYPQRLLKRKVITENEVVAVFCQAFLKPLFKEDFSTIKKVFLGVGDGILTPIHIRERDEEGKGVKKGDIIHRFAYLCEDRIEGEVKDYIRKVILTPDGKPLFTAQNISSAGKEKDKFYKFVSKTIKMLKGEEFLKAHEKNIIWSEY